MGEERAISCRRFSDAVSGVDAISGGGFRCRFADSVEFGANVDRSVISKWPAFFVYAHLERTLGEAHTHKHTPKARMQSIGPDLRLLLLKHVCCWAERTGR